MKRILSVLSLLFIAQSIFAQEVKITGKLINFKSNGNDTACLKINSSMNNPIVLKSAISKKGEFKFTYTENATNYCELYFLANSSNPDLNSEEKLPLFLSSGELVSISAEASRLNETAVVTGSTQTDAMQKNVRTLQAYMNEAQVLKKRYEFQVDSLEKRKNDQLANAIRRNPNMLSNLSVISVLPMETYSDVYQLLDSALMATYPNNDFVRDYHEQMRKMMVLREGMVIDDIILADASGKMKNLESLRGNVVLIDFWASWCRPCRMEIPNFKKLYESYHSSGFDIFSVSVDNDMFAWRTALEQEKMPWINVRDDQKIYSNKYNVSSIPFTILIDKEGKIIAKGLRGPELDKAIGKALGKQ